MMVPVSLVTVAIFPARDVRRAPSPSPGLCMRAAHQRLRWRRQPRARARDTALLPKSINPVLSAVPKARPELVFPCLRDHHHISPISIHVVTTTAAPVAVASGQAMRL